MARSPGVYGGKEIARKIRSMRLSEEDIARSAAAALKPMQESARNYFQANGSYVTGVLPEQFVIVKKGRGEFALTCTGNAAKLMHLIEFGTEPHDQPLRGTRHPGSDPKPTFRPAYETERMPSLKAAITVLGNSVKTQVLK